MLEESQPSIRFLTLTQQLEEPQDDPEVQSAKQMIPDTGWTADILAKQTLGGMSALPM